MTYNKWYSLKNLDEWSYMISDELCLDVKDTLKVFNGFENKQQK